MQGLSERGCDVYNFNLESQGVRISPLNLRRLDGLVREIENSGNSCKSVGIRICLDEKKEVPQRKMRIRLRDVSRIHVSDDWL
ncbi:MAG: hypothetical protein QOG17_3143 [Gammaproteobacteria bacterium]|nr:hypothetical protein [Gammaproteobacteria bacterium]